jgi:hypothetical protein
VSLCGHDQIKENASNNRDLKLALFPTSDACHCSYVTSAISDCMLLPDSSITSPKVSISLVASVCGLELCSAVIREKEALCLENKLLLF